MKTISIINQKGGVGKSTISATIIAGLTQRGFKVLGIDLDAQGNLSQSFKLNREGGTVFGILTKEIELEDAIKSTELGDFIPASNALIGADAIITETGKEYRLKEALETVQARYDYCIIDTPPSLGILTVNALTASDFAVIPSQADSYSLQGIGQLSNTIQTVRKYCNPELSIAGIVLTRYSGRAVLSKNFADLAKDVATKLGTVVFDAKIRDAVAVREAQALQRDIFSYAPKAKVTADFTAFIEELLPKIK